MEQCEHLIRTYFPQVDRILATGNIMDFAHIGYFLENPENTIIELEKLEAVHQQRFIERWGRTKPQQRMPDI